LSNINAAGPNGLRMTATGGEAPGMVGARRSVVLGEPPLERPRTHAGEWLNPQPISAVCLR
jgi:hypothetical protein